MAEIFRHFDENEIVAVAEGKAGASARKAKMHMAVCPECREAVAWLREVIATTPKNLPVASCEALPFRTSPKRKA